MKNAFLNLVFIFIFMIISEAYGQSSPAADANLIGQARDNFNFIENKGQWQSEILYAAKLQNMNVLVTKSGILYDFFSIVRERISGDVLSMELLSQTSPKFQGLLKHECIYNYFKGNDASKWAVGVSSYKEVAIENAFEGIDAKIKIRGGRPQYDFFVRAGADPSKIKFKIEGAETMIGENDELIIKTQNGQISHRELFAYQVVDGIKSEIGCRFEKNGNIIGFEVDKFDRDRELIIDPLVYSSYLGGNGDDEINAIAFAPDGNLVVSGTTQSPDFRITSGSYTDEYLGGEDVFVSKFEVDGVNYSMLFTTILGTTDYDVAGGMDVDMDNNIYVCGHTISKDFPLVGEVLPIPNDEIEVFISKLSPDGTELIYSSLIGGKKNEFARALKISRDNTPVVIGNTFSSDFPTKTNYTPDIRGLSDIFVIKLTSSGNAFDYSTILGGSATDIAYALDIDDENSVYITGETNSGDFPTVPLRIFGQWVWEKPYDHTYNGGKDAFLIKLGGGSNLVFSTYFGGFSDECGRAVAVNLSDGSVFFAGETKKENGERQFPVTDFAYQIKHNGETDGFIAQISKLKKNQWNQLSQDLILSGLIGGSQEESINSIVQDQQTGKIIVSGHTSSTNYPVLSSGDGAKHNGSIDAFITEFTVDGTEVVASSYIGGQDDDYPLALELTPRGDIFLAGKTKSKNIENYGYSEQADFAGGSFDGFIIKNVYSSLFINGPFGGEEYCSGMTVPINWMNTGFKVDETFDVQIGRESSSSWTTIATGVVGSSFVWDIPSDMTQADDYIARVTHSSGAYALSNGPFSILNSPEITGVQVDPSNLDICEGEDVSFSANAIGANLQYQWYHNGEEIIGEEGPELLLTEAIPEQAGTYKLIVSGQCNPAVESQEYQLAIVPKTSIVKQPQDQSVLENRDVTFRVEAIGGELEYQWYKDGMELYGENHDSLRIEGLALADSGMYHCKVTGRCGEDVSTEAKLMVEEDDVSVFDDPGYSNSSDLVIKRVYQESGSGEAVIELRAGAKASLNIRLTDLTGQTMLSRPATISAIGSNIIRVPVNGLANGTYWIIVQSNGKIAARKFLLVK